MTTETTRRTISPAASAVAHDEGAFGALLASAVKLLRELPRGGDQVGRARDMVSAWGADRPAAAVTLVVDEPPGQVEVDHDLLLDHPAGGTVALSIQTDDGVPWSVDHATHWAAGYVLTIDDEHHLTVPDALLALRSAGRSRPSLLSQLVDHRILQAEVTSDPTREPLAVEDVQAAADTYRRRLGLLSAEDTRAWLDQIGLTTRAFDAHVTNLAFVTRFRERLEAELGPAYLADHPDEFSVVRAVWGRCSRADVAKRLAAAEPARLLDTAMELADTGERVECGMVTGPPDDMPEVLREALPNNEPRRVVGPLVDAGRWLVGAVLDHGPMPPGPELTAAAGRAAFVTWMRERRAAATIQWHWL